MTRTVLMLSALLVLGLVDSAVGGLAKQCTLNCGAAIANCEAAALMFGGGAYGPGAKMIAGGCKKAVLKYCKKRGVAMCGQLSSCAGQPVCGDTVTTTTLQPVTTTTIGTTTSVTATTTTTTTLPPVPDPAKYEGYYDFAGQLTSNTCDISNLPESLFAMLSVSNHLDTHLTGALYDSFFADFESQGTATWPEWEFYTNACEVQNIEHTWCGQIIATMTGVPFDHGDSVPAAIRLEVTGSQNCVVTWTGDLEN